MSIIQLLNKWLNPNHPWTDYSSPEWGDKGYGKFSSDSSASGVVASGGLSGLIESLINRLTGAHLTGAEQEANEFSAGEAQKSRDFTEYMTRNKYQMETQSMQEAGVNPAMMYGGGNLVSTASNGATATSAQPSAASLFDILPTLARLPAEIDLLKAQAEEQRASAENKAEGTKGLSIDNAWKERLNSLKAQGEEASINLTKAREGEVYQNIEVGVNQAHKLYEEAKTEASKRLVNESVKALNEAKARQIVELLPYEKALSEARTLGEKASAAFAFANAAYQNGLINAGYIDALVENTKSEMESRDADTDAQWLKNALTRYYNEGVLNGMSDSNSEELVGALYQGLSGIRGALKGSF